MERVALARVQRDQQVAGSPSYSVVDRSRGGPSARRMRAQRTAVTRLPVADPGGAGVTMQDLHDATRRCGSRPRRRGGRACRSCARCCGAGAPRVAQQPPRSTLWVPNQGSRVLLVRVGDEAGVGQEVARRPLPDVADHLPAAEGAVARGQRADVDAAAAPAVEVGAVGRRAARRPTGSAACGREPPSGPARRRPPSPTRPRSAAAGPPSGSRPPPRTS